MENKILKTDFVDWKKLKLFQPANLKKLSKTELEKLKTSLKNNGLKSPFFVWEKNKDIWCLDGHMRIPVMKLLEDEGEFISEKLPANFIDCKNKKDAKKSVLIYNSRYGDIIGLNLFDWIEDLDFEDIDKEINIEKLQIKDIDNIDFEENPERAVRKIKCPKCSYEILVNE